MTESGPGPAAGIAPVARVDALDGVRGWLALVVLFAHAVETFYPSISGSGPDHLGVDDYLNWSPFAALLAADFAVRIFFVHSGFVLSLKYWRSRDARWPTAMLVRRPARLGLPILGATLVGFVLLALVHPTANEIGRIVGVGPVAVPDPPGLVTSLADGAYQTLLLGDNAVPGGWWTMPVELYCSVLLLGGVLVAARFRLRRALLVAGVVYGGVLLATALVHPDAPEQHFDSFTAAAHLVLVQSFAFALGAGVAYLWVDHRRRFTELRARRGAIWVVGLGALALGVFPSVPLRLLGHNDSLLQLAVIAGAALILVVVLAAPPLQRIFERPMSRWVGRLSFSVYLLHGAVLRSVMDRSALWMFERGWPYNLVGPVSIALAVVLTLALAVGLAATFDRVALRVGKRRVHQRLGLPVLT